MDHVLLKNEEEYISWVADLVEYGSHEPNHFSTPNERGTHVCDRFNRYDSEDVYKHFGIYSGEVSPYAALEEDDDYDDSQPWDRSCLKVDHEHEDQLGIWIPQLTDYPILYSSFWYDSFDRSGDILVRNNVWFSLNGPHQRYDSVKTLYDQWQQDHGKEKEEWIRLSTERWERGTANA